MTCHSSATCENLSKGFCCKCIQGWYGDGKNCLPKDIPQRVTGKVDMCVNDITVEKQELHCYVLTQDGRTYTAISKYIQGVPYALCVIFMILVSLENVKNIAMWLQDYLKAHWDFWSQNVHFF